MKGVMILCLIFLTYFMFLFCLIVFLREMRKEKKRRGEKWEKEKKIEEEKREGGEGSHFACSADDDINDVRCLDGKWLSYWCATFAVCVNENVNILGEKSFLVCAGGRWLGTESGCDQ